MTKSKEELRNFIITIKDMPSLPSIVMELLSSLSNDKISIQQITKILEKDPVLVSKILKVINSSYYSVRFNITSLKQAIVLLGLREIKRITIGTSVINTFENSKDSDKFDRISFWQHCLGCGKIAEMIAEKFNFPFKDQAFLGGLLHDIGKVVVNIFFFDEFKQVLEECRKPDISFRQAEKMIIGADHTETGFWFAERWKFPGTIKDVIKNHHNLEEAENKLLCATIRFADLMCKTRQIGSGEDDENIKIDFRKEEAWKIIEDNNKQIDNMDLERFTFEIEDELIRIEEFVKEAIN